MITIPSGTNFTSNGQRNATAEIRLDGALLSAPEQGEGGNSNVYYEPLVEGMQEMKVQNNSFSAEFGNNGGTVVNMVHEERKRCLPRQRLVFPAARAVGRSRFLQSRQSVGPKPDSKRDQGGFSLGGPIRKNRTFFFVDFEKVRSSSATSGVVTVPTLAERQGDFSATANPIFDPTAQGCGNPCINRPQVQYNGAIECDPAERTGSHRSGRPQSLSETQQRRTSSITTTSRR